jgi:Do/DeqQ family serine protease
MMVSRKGILRGVAIAAAMLALGAAGASAAETQVPASAAEMQLSFAPIVKRVAPAVVNVYASRTVQQQSPFFADPFFRQFFGNLGGGAPSTRVQRSLGSGVIIDPSGLIVTNFHVIAQADEVKVALFDKREFAADIILKDERSDLAVLKLKGDVGTLPTIAYADSDAVQVGDLALAIGDPFGVGQTVTSGIISAFARVPGNANEDQYFIQTDAAINPGNSGGALVDINGRLIGINRMIVSSGGGSNGIGFAIPSNLVKVVASAALSGGVPKRPWLGADLQEVTPEIAASMTLDTPSGVLVSSVDAKGPADAAGLKSGDLIVAIDGEQVDDVGALSYRLATHKLGTTALAGLTVLNLSPAVADELSYPGTPKGVIVSDVADGSNAEAAGFRKGDIIAKVNGVTIDTTARLASAAGGAQQYWDLAIRRGGRLIQQQFRG